MRGAGGGYSHPPIIQRVPWRALFPAFSNLAHIASTSWLNTLGNYLYLCSSLYFLALASRRVARIVVPIKCFSLPLARALIGHSGSLDADSVFHERY